MSELIGIVGKSGTGKSTSTRNLNPTETYYINVSGKSLPFKGWKSKYNAESKNYLASHDWKTIVNVLKGISDKRKDVKHIILDDAQYLMGFEFMNRASEKSYDKFTDIGVHLNEVINASKGLRDDIKVYMLWHPEIGDDGQYKMKTVGKMIDQYLTLEGLFSILLYTDVDVDKNGAEYYFVTNHIKNYPAKSPMGMFPEIRIPNDLSQVSNMIDIYNN